MKIKVKNLGEHHMGAESVEMELPFELDGYTHFYSTNGRVVPSRNSGQVYIFDATVILKIDLNSQSSEYLLPPWGKYISEFEEIEEGYRIGLYGIYSRPKDKLLALGEAKFKKGLGPIKKGLFPSAHKPHIKQFKRLNT